MKLEDLLSPCSSTQTLIHTYLKFMINPLLPAQKQSAYITTRGVI